MVAACMEIMNGALPDFGKATELVGAAIDKKLLNGASQGAFSLRI